MVADDSHDNRFFDVLKQYATLYPTVIDRLRAAKAAGNVHVAKAVETFALVSRQAESSQLVRWRAQYGLTEAQARLALFLVEGGTITAYASRMGLRPSTVRTHLKSLFVKTGVKRQTDLAILLLDRTL